MNGDFVARNGFKLLVRIIDNNKIYAYFGLVKVCFAPQG